MTRKEYLEIGGKDAHEQYYAQFVTQEIKDRVISYFGLERLVRSFQADKHFNTDLTPLRHWDSLRLPFGTDGKLHKQGDYLTQAGSVCILKEAARQAVKEHLAEQE